MSSVVEQVFTVGNAYAHGHKGFVNLMVVDDGIFDGVITNASEIEKLSQLISDLKIRAEFVEFAKRTI